MASDSSPKGPWIESRCFKTRGVWTICIFFSFFKKCFPTLLIFFLQGYSTEIELHIYQKWPGDPPWYSDSVSDSQAKDALYTQLLLTIKHCISMHAIMSCVKYKSNIHEVLNANYPGRGGHRGVVVWCRTPKPTAPGSNHGGDNMVTCQPQSLDLPVRARLNWIQTLEWKRKCLSI